MTTGWVYYSNGRLSDIFGFRDSCKREMERNNGERMLSIEFLENLRNSRLVGFSLFPHDGYRVACAADLKPREVQKRLELLVGKCKDVVDNCVLVRMG